MKAPKFFFVTMVVVVMAAFLFPPGLAAQSMPTTNNTKSPFTSFDAPGAGTGFLQGTYAFSVNLFAAVTGYDLDANNVYHGFLRKPDGSIVVFDAPGADTTEGDFNGTFPAGINDAGLIAGYYIDASNVGHGFLRSPNGSFTTFDPPGAGTAPGQGTIVHGLNLEGTVVGSFLNDKTYYAFIRTSDGKYKTFAAPGACNMSIDDGCHGSGAWDINFFGTVVGPYEDTSGNFVAHTYVRSPNGKFTTFVVPGSSMEAGQGTLPASLSGLNDFGAITGLYYDVNNVFHGYLRNPDGRFIKFEAPGADTTDEFFGTFPNSLNDFGSIAGDYLDSSDVYHGFLRHPDGKFTEFDAPGADTTAGDFNGTIPEGVNLVGAITGVYYDTNSASHGFLRIPSDENQLLQKSNYERNPVNRVSQMVIPNGSDPRRNAVSPILRPHTGLVTPWDRRLGSHTAR
jgi:hypothetical protein